MRRFSVIYLAPGKPVINYDSTTGALCARLTHQAGYSFESPYWANRVEGDFIVFYPTYDNDISRPGDYYVAHVNDVFEEQDLVRP